MIFQMDDRRYNYELWLFSFVICTKSVINLYKIHQIEIVIFSLSVTLSEYPNGSLYGS